MNKIEELIEEREKAKSPLIRYIEGVHATRGSPAGLGFVLYVTMFLFGRVARLFQNGCHC